jgi:hypothetical protein
MKRPLAPIATILVLLTVLVVAACGHAGNAAHPGPDPGALTADGDPSTETTPDGFIYDGDDAPTRFYGHRADRHDEQAIGALVKRYYAAAARDDGTAACRLVHKITIEATIESYAERPGTHTEDCGAILAGLFEQHHREIVRDNATLKVVDIRVGSLTALALLRFGKASQPVHLEVHREGSTWKLWSLLARRMP